MRPALTSSRKVADLHLQGQTAILTCLVAVVCYYAVILTFRLGVPPERIAPFWPAAPFLVAVLLMSSTRIWPALIAAGLGGIALANFRDGWPIVSETWFTVANLAEVLLAAGLTSYLFKGVPQLRSLRALAKYFLVPVTLAPFVSVLVGAGAIVGAPGSYWLKWRLWFFADVLGFLTVTPAILSWAQEGRAWARESRNYVELAALMTSLTGCGYVTFVGIWRWQSPALLYSLVPIFLYAALRLGLKGVSTSMVVVAFLSTWGVSRDGGPFTGQGPLNNALSIQIFLFFGAISFTVLAVLAEEQKRAQQALADEGDQLAEAQRLAQVGSWWWDPENDTVTWSEELYRIAKRDPSRPAPNYAEHARLYTQESWKRLQRVVERALRTGEPYELDLEMLLPDGSTKWLMARGDALVDKVGHVVNLRGTVKDITERKRVEETLRESEERFRLVANTAPVMIWMSGPDKRCTYVNQRWLEFTGRSCEAELARDWAHGIHPDEFEKSLETYRQAFDRQEAFRIEYRLMRHDGDYRWIIDHGVPRFNPDGSFAGYIGSAIDVTDRKLAERELALANDRLRIAMESAKSTGWDRDIKSGLDTWFGDLQSMFGIPSDTYVGRLEDFVDRQLHPEDRVRVVEEAKDSMENKKPYASEYRILGPDGTVRWVAVKGKFFYSAKGEPERMVGMKVDITERKLMEVALRESEERLRLAAQAGKMYAFEWDASTDVITRSDEVTHIPGLVGAPARLTKKELLAEVHPEDRARFVNSIAELTVERPKCQASFRVLRSDGSVLWLERTGHAFFDKQGKMVRMIGMVADITERKLAEREVALATDRLRMAMEAGKSVGWDRDVRSGRDVLFGDLQDIFGMQLETYVGRVEDFHRRVHPEDSERIVKAIDDAMEGRKPYAAEFRLVLPDGKVRWLSAKGKFYYSPDGEPERMVGMAVDITERKLAEEALSTVSQKLIEAQEHERSRLARDLHDDINQRMALLAVAMDGMKESLPSTAVQLAQQIEEANNQIADITKDIQAVSHRLHSPKLDLLGLAAAAKSFCQEFSESHHVEIEYRSENVPKELLPEVSLSLFRILQEALQNAAKHSGSRRLQVSLSGQANEIELIVHDFGRGFDLEQASKGRGLGLTSMKERLKLVGGELSIESELEHGTTLHARVPLGPRMKSAAARR